ncbi:unnamed protein product, partial [Pleuronectes platessa]
MNSGIKLLPEIEGKVCGSAWCEVDILALVDTSGDEGRRSENESGHWSALAEVGSPRAIVANCSSLCLDSSTKQMREACMVLLNVPTQANYSHQSACKGEGGEERHSGAGGSPNSPCLFSSSFSFSSRGFLPPRATFEKETDMKRTVKGLRVICLLQLCHPAVTRRNAPLCPGIRFPLPTLLCLC